MWENNNHRGGGGGIHLQYEQTVLKCTAPFLTLVLKGVLSVRGDIDEEDGFPFELVEVHVVVVI